jgi:hypothetical protein
MKSANSAMGRCPIYYCRYPVQKMRPRGALARFDSSVNIRVECNAGIAPGGTSPTNSAFPHSELRVRAFLPALVVLG